MRPPSPGKIRIRSTHLYGLSLASILLCIVLWTRAKTVGEDERANAERRALFIGAVAVDALADRRSAPPPRGGAPTAPAAPRAVVGSPA